MEPLFQEFNTPTYTHTSSLLSTRYTLQKRNKSASHVSPPTCIALPSFPRISPVPSLSFIYMVHFHFFSPPLIPPLSFARLMILRLINGSLEKSKHHLISHFTPSLAYLRPAPKKELVGYHNACEKRTGDPFTIRRRQSVMLELSANTRQTQHSLLLLESNTRQYIYISENLQTDTYLFLKLAA